MKQVFSSFRRFAQDECGTSTIEFVFTFPIIILIFCASIESSMYTLRAASLERSVDIVVRDLRLGALGSISHWNLKGEICEKGLFLGKLDKCQQALQIELQPISMADVQMPVIPVICRDRTEVIDPAVTPEPPDTEYKLGDGNQIMLMRVCFQADPMFPSTMYGVRINTRGPDGGYSIVTTTTFVNEPRT
jgi:hypothetical protein